MKVFFVVITAMVSAAAAAFAGCGTEGILNDGGTQDAGAADGGGGGDGGTEDSGPDAGAADGSTSKTEPDPSFFEPVSAKSALLNLKGLINGYQDILDGSATDGIGAAAVTCAGKTVELNEMARVFSYTFPQDYSRADWRGETFLIMDLYHTREGGADYAYYDTLRVYVPVKDLMAAKTSGAGIFTFGSMGYLTFVDLKVNVRRDKTYLSRYCYEALADAGVAESKYFVNHEDNVSFSAGENVKIWGNLAVDDDKALINASLSGLQDDNGQLCRYYKDEKAISRDVYYKELKIDFDLDCALPDGFLDPRAADYAAGMFKGLINDGASENQVADGVSSYKAGFGGKEYKVDDYSAYSISFMSGMVPMIGTITLGSVETVAAGHYTYLASELYTAVQDLKDLKSGSANVMNFSGYNIVFDVSAIEQKDAGKKSYFKQCVKAVIADDVKSALFVCHDGNTDFSAGENLQEAAGLVLTTNPDDILAYTGTGDPCFCYDEASGTLDCAEFDKM